MAKQIVLFADGRVKTYDDTDKEFVDLVAANRQQHAAQTEVFQKMLLELEKMDDAAYRKQHADEFLRINAVWLHNLAKTGFATTHKM